MTAKEKLRQVIEDLAEPEAAETLAFIADRRNRDPVLKLFENAPEDDEPLTPEEKKSLETACTQRARAVPLDEIRHEFD